MVFSKTDYKQFITEIKFIGRQKEFSRFNKGFKNRDHKFLLDTLITNSRREI